MDTRDYSLQFKARTPLLMHRDDLQWQERIKRWEKDPKNNAKSKAGEDRSPAWRWIGSLYHDGRVLALPSDAVMAVIRCGGTRVKVPGANSKKTFKSQTQSGISPAEPYWPLLIQGKTVPMSAITPLMDLDNFDDHLTAVRALGFDLDVRRVPVGMSKHVRVRPIFANWEAQGIVHVFDEEITDEVVGQILEYAGKYYGLLDWRPGAKSPGPFGTFTATVHALETV